MNYRENFGGLVILGYPLTKEFDRCGITVQFFERASIGAPAPNGHKLRL